MCMKTKEWLNRALNVEKEISILEEELEEVSNRITYTSIHTDKDKVEATAKSKDTGYLAMIQYQTMLSESISNLYAVKLEIVEVINSVDDSVARCILELRYLKGEKWETIANCINYDYYYTIKVLHPKALKLATQYIKPIKTT